MLKAVPEAASAVGSGVDTARAPAPSLTNEKTPSNNSICSTLEADAAIAFTRLVSVLMRSSSHKFCTLADLEWLVIPPLLSGQFALVDVIVGTQRMPVFMGRQHLD